MNTIRLDSLKRLIHYVFSLVYRLPYLVPQVVATTHKSWPCGGVVVVIVVVGFCSLASCN